MLGYSGDNKINKIIITAISRSSVFTLLYFFSFSFFFFFPSSPIYLLRLYGINIPVLTDSGGIPSPPPNSRSPSNYLPAIFTPLLRSISRLFLSILSSLFPLLVRCSCPCPAPSLLPLLSLSAPRRNRSPPTRTGSLTSRNRATNPYSASLTIHSRSFYAINSTPGSSWDCGSLSTLLNAYITYHWQRRKKESLEFK